MTAAILLGALTCAFLAFAANRPGYHLIGSMVAAGMAIVMACNLIWFGNELASRSALLLVE